MYSLVKVSFIINCLSASLRSFFAHHLVNSCVANPETTCTPTPISAATDSSMEPAILSQPLY